MPIDKCSQKRVELDGRFWYYNTWATLATLPNLCCLLFSRRTRLYGHAKARKYRAVIA
jgi:hypothetical protein